LHLQKKSKGTLCQFKEHVRDPITGDELVYQYQSLSNGDWFIGFNKHGRSLRGDHWKSNPKQLQKLRKLFTFQKVEILAETLARNEPYSDDLRTGSVGGQGGLMKNLNDPSLDMRDMKDSVRLGT